MLRNFVGIAVLLLGGCTASGSSVTVMNNLNKQFDGQKAEKFFLSYGQPTGEPVVEEGGKVYRWASLEQDEGALAPVFRRSETQGRSSFIAESSASGPVERYCMLKIEVDAKDRIRKLSIIEDSPGKWSNSRCMELFDDGSANPQ